MAAWIDYSVDATFTYEEQTSPLAPKTNCNPAKLTSIVQWLQRTRTAWNIKDLEKQLPSVASINGMQVKDYLQSLSDDSRINVEKIGSGNWYWSFASEALKTHHRALDDAKAAYEKQADVNETLQRQLDQARAAREGNEEGNDVSTSGETRMGLEAEKAALEAEVTKLRKEVAAYGDNDPTELERKREQVTSLRQQAEVATDDVYSIEGYLTGVLGMDAEGMKELRKMFYGDEFDEEEGVLRELV
ncbi:meiotic nuclear division protein 1 [Polychaeton citri CBS 116435]|uniref:Meiotic nuclear division protein 1 n=1 Tax=Polychaeton citri CBS 116435 TaxID=1314669 RepID=A0A9P4Q490_9PEZI|nr:meiotic nuclear division protein 1 [Polychaeton citri CBS 116435]